MVDMVEFSLTSQELKIVKQSQAVVHAVFKAAAVRRYACFCPPVFCNESSPAFPIAGFWFVFQSFQMKCTRGCKKGNHEKFCAESTCPHPQEECR